MTKKLLFGSVFIGLLLLCASAPALAEQRPVKELIDVISSSGLDALKARLVSPEGEVVKVKNGVCYITNESGAILKKGSELTIVRAGEKITHPVTGEELGNIIEPVGKVRVTSSDKKLIYAVEASGSDKIKPGDKIGPPDKKPLVALVMDMPLVSWEPKAVALELGRNLGKWRGVDWVEQYAVDRFIFDEGLQKRASIINKKTFKNLRDRLKADYLLFLGVKEKGGEALTDISLYKLDGGDGGLEPLVLSRGISPVKPIKMNKSVAAKKTPSLKSPSVSPERAINKSRSVKPAPPVAPAPVAGKTERGSGILGGYKSKMLGQFDGSIAALLAYDLDKDGVKEIVIGFDHKIAVFKWSDEKLERVWEKDLGARNQIIGLGAGDFNANGEVEIYVNNAAFSKIQSIIIERENGSFKVIRKKAPMVFYTGSDDKLYGQEQKPDYKLKDEVVELTWRESGFGKTPFMTLPAGRSMTGLGFFDLDGDGLTDIAGYGKDRKLHYYTSKEKRWKRLSGRLGGSNVKIKLYEEDGVDIFHEFLAPTLFLTDSKGHPIIITISNKSSLTLTVDHSFTKAQVVVIEYDGSTFAEKTRTPMAEGAIQGAVMFDPGALKNMLLISRSYFSFFGKDRSELILLDLDRY